MTTWEYTELKVIGAGDDESGVTQTWVGTCNNAGADGWELISQDREFWAGTAGLPFADPNDVEPPSITYRGMFKRPLADKGKGWGSDLL